MPYTTDFQTFAEGATSETMESAAEYTADTQRQNGLVPGIANPRMHNKLFQQLTRFANALTQAIANTLSQNVVDDGDLTALAEQFEGALGGKVIRGSSTFNSATGRTIPHTIGSTAYDVAYSVSDDPNLTLGEVRIVKAADGFTIYNSGTFTGAFDYRIEY